MAQVNPSRSIRTLWIRFAVRAWPCASTIDETTILVGRTKYERLEKEVIE